MAWSSSFLIRMVSAVAITVVPFESSVYALPKMREGFVSISFIRFPIVLPISVIFFVLTFLPRSLMFPEVSFSNT